MAAKLTREDAKLATAECDRPAILNGKFSLTGKVESTGDGTGEGDGDGDSESVRRIFRTPASSGKRP